MNSSAGPAARRAGCGRIRSLTAQTTAKRLEYADTLTRLKVFDAEYGSLVAVSTLTLPAVQHLLDPDTTLLAYFSTPERTLAFRRRDFCAG